MAYIIETLLTKQERAGISQAVTDMSSGNHLLCKRTEEQRKMMSKIFELQQRQQNKLQLGGKDKEILEYAAACEDPLSMNRYMHKYRLHNSDL